MYTTTEKIKMIRNLKGFSQEYMAQKLNIHQKTYSNLERSDKEPSAKVLETIAKALGVTSEYIANFSPSYVVNNFNGEFSGNNYNVKEMIINSEEKIIRYIKSVFEELKKTPIKK